MKKTSSPSSDFLHKSYKLELTGNDLFELHFALGVLAGCFSFPAVDYTDGRLERVRHSVLLAVNRVCVDIILAARDKEKKDKQAALVQAIPPARELPERQWGAE